MAKRKRHDAIQSGRAIVASASDVDIDSFTVMPDGRKMQRTVFGLTEEQVGRIRAGYTCVKCLEDHAAPYPDACSVCKFPMRPQQAEEFAKDFRGNIRYGSEMSDEDELAAAEEQIQRDAYDKATALGLIIPKPSIIVPR